MPGVTRKPDALSEAMKGVHDEVCSIYREELAERGMSRDFIEWDRHWYQEKGDGYTTYLMLV